MRAVPADGMTTLCGGLPDASSAYGNRISGLWPFCERNSGGVREVVNGQAATAVNFVLGNTWRGVPGNVAGLDFDATNDQLDTNVRNDKLIPPGSTAATLWVAFMPDVTNVDQRLVQLTDSTGTATKLTVRIGAVSGQFGGTCRDSGGTLQSVNGGTVNAGQLNTVAWSCRPGLAELYGNGRLIGSTTSFSASQTFAFGTQTTKIGGFDTTSGILNGVITVAMILLRPMGAGEVAERHSRATLGMYNTRGMQSFFPPSTPAGGLFKGSLASMGVGI